MRARKGDILLVATILGSICLVAWWSARRAELDAERTRSLPLYAGMPFDIVPGARATWTLEPLSWNQKRGKAYLWIHVEPPVAQGSIEFLTAALGHTLEGQAFDPWTDGGPQHSVLKAGPGVPVSGIGRGVLDLTPAASARFEIEVLSVQPEMPGLRATLGIQGREDASLLEAHLLERFAASSALAGGLFVALATVLSVLLQRVLRARQARSRSA